MTETVYTYDETCRRNWQGLMTLCLQAQGNLWYAPDDNYKKYNWKSIHALLQELSALGYDSLLDTGFLIDSITLYRGNRFYSKKEIPHIKFIPTIEGGLDVIAWIYQREFRISLIKISLTDQLRVLLDMLIAQPAE